MEKLDLRREQIQNLISEKKQVEVIIELLLLLCYRLITVLIRRNFQISRVDLPTHKKLLLPVKIKYSLLQKSLLLTDVLYSINIQCTCRYKQKCRQLEQDNLKMHREKEQLAVSSLLAY